MQKNKDLPALPVHPIQDKFGQVILMTGFTKQEAVAIEILKSMLIANYQDNPEDINFMIRESYDIAEKFVSYLENKIDQ